MVTDVVLNNLLSSVALVHFVEWMRPVTSEGIVEMTGPPGKKKHTGIFIKQSKNKTIPYSEKPGEELLVFDVDGTLWPFHVDSDPRFQDPFTIKGFENGTALVGNHTVNVYPEVEETLLELIEKGYVLAAVSLTNSTHKTMALLNALDLTKHFKHMEMAPGPSKLGLVEAICSRTGLLLENVLFFERDGGPDDVIDCIWRHVIIYSVGLEKGLTKEVASKGLYVFDIRPRKERRQNGQQEKPEKREKTNKNKSRPAMEKDGTEIEGFDYNATKIEYIDR